jgi:hypothetical protein
MKARTIVSLDRVADRVTFEICVSAHDAALNARAPQIEAVGLCRVVESGEAARRRIYRIRIAEARVT